MHRFRGPLSRIKAASASKSLVACTTSGARTLHTVKGLPYDVNKGLGDFLPPDALRVVGLEYQKGLLDRLNDEVRGTDMEGQSVVQTIISASPDRSRVLAFNYASLALNNHFFLEQLKPPVPPHASHEHLISTRLESTIRSQHGTLAQLKSAFSAAAMGLFTSGYVWFVTDAAGNTAVIPTYGPGSLLMRSQTYMAHVKGLELGKDELDELQRREYEAQAQEGSTMTTPNPTPRRTPPGTAPASPASAVSSSSSSQPPNPPHTRSLHTTSSVSSSDDDLIARFSAQPSTPTSNTNALRELTLYPLFCVSVHEHAWMSAGYGIWGKEEWLKKFWDVLDWEKVSESYRLFVVDSK
ncbi:manganese superoxide dismutase [Lentinula raphanica]|nr:manganese superoxide dismutase [Lentinula raphanica]